MEAKLKTFNFEGSDVGKWLVAWNVTRSHELRTISLGRVDPREMDR